MSDDEVVASDVPPRYLFRRTSSSSCRDARTTAMRGQQRCRPSYLFSIMDCFFLICVNFYSNQVDTDLSLQLLGFLKRSQFILLPVFLFGPVNSVENSQAILLEQIYNYIVLFIECIESIGVLGVPYKSTQKPVIE